MSGLSIVKFKVTMKVLNNYNLGKGNIWIFTKE